MSIFKNVFSKIRPEEWLAFFVFVVVGYLNVFVYKNGVSLLEAVRLMISYFTFGDPLYYLVLVAVYCSAILIFYTNLSEIMNDWVVKGDKPTLSALKSFCTKVFSPIRSILPIVLVSGPMYQLLHNISYQFRFDVKDVLLARADHALIGNFLFISLPSRFNSEWFNLLMQYSYTSLATCIGITLVLILFLKNDTLMRLAIAAFIFSNIVAYPFFYVLPAQGPLYSLILNMRSMNIPSDISSVISEYNPSVYTQKSDENIMMHFIDKNTDNSAAVSCLPSMHATWGFIVVYLLWRVRRYTLFFTIPWVVLMLLGGLYFSQHYFIDYVAAVPVAMVSILFAHLLIDVKRFKKLGFVNN